MKALFVCYGGGHVEMCLPVLRALRALAPHCEARIMALTTAHAVARRAGETPLGYRDFCSGDDGAAALRYGEQLIAGHQHPSVAREESLAYLGLNFLEWVQAEGEERAWQRWKEAGRFGFMPVQFFQRVLRELQPDVVVSTNSPRSEAAVVQAAQGLGIPSLSMVDLFALPGDPFLTRAVQATRICVLAGATRANLMAAGIDAARIVVTGNPAIDALSTPEAIAQGQSWRAARGWQSKNVVLFAGHKEPDVSPWAGTALGQAVQQRLVEAVLAHEELALALRYHPNEWQDFALPPAHPRIHWSQPGTEDLLPVLLGADQVVVQATTVGAQARVAGKRLLCLGFSPLVQKTGMDYANLGMGEGVDSLDDLLPLLLDGQADTSARAALATPGTAASAVAREILSLTAGTIAP